MTGAADGAKNGVGPSVRGFPLRLSRIAMVPLPT
jgi:hypothetical protein